MKSQENMVRKSSHLSADKKYQIFLEATMAKGNGNKIHEDKRSASIAA